MQELGPAPGLAPAPVICAEPASQPPAPGDTTSATEDKDAGRPAERLFEEFRTERRRYHEGYYSPGARKLAKLGAEAVPYLVKGMNSDDDYVAKWSRSALSWIGRPSIPALRQLSEGAQLKVRTEALIGLAVIGGPVDKTTRENEIRPIFLRALDDEEPEIRKWALYGLQSFRDEETGRLMIAALKDRSPIVRAEAALCLRTTKDSLAGPHLIAALKDESAEVREAVACALGSRRDKGAIQALMTLRDDPSSDVRWNAVVSLRHLCDMRSIRCLVAFLDDREECKHGSPATEAAGIIGHKIGRPYRNFPVFVAKAKEWWKTIGKSRYGALEIPERPAKYVNPAYAYHVKKVLPTGWEVLWSDECEAPRGWNRTDSGKPGIHLHLWQPDVRARAPNGHDYIPNCDVYFMPVEWEGRSVPRNEAISDGKLVTTEVRHERRALQGHPAPYCGTDGKILLFCSCAELAEWRTAPEDIVRAFDIELIPQ